MGIIDDLAGIKGFYAEEKRRKEEGAAAKNSWFKIASDSSANILFLQELSDASTHFDANKGKGFLASEHTNPEDWHKRALCSADEGSCVGCEQNTLGWKSNDGKAEKDPTRYKGGWKAKRRLYINVLVDLLDGEPAKVAVLSQADTANGVATDIIDFAVEDNTLCDGWFKITKKGEGFDTNYRIKAMPKLDLPTKEEIDALELFDLFKCVREIPYEEQTSFYGISAHVAEPTVVSVASGAADSDDNSW